MSAKSSAKSIVWLALAGALFATPVMAAEFTPLAPSLMDVGCSYSRGETEPPFLVVLTLSPVGNGPRVFLGLDGEDLDFEIEDEGEASASFLRPGLRLVVHYDALVEQACGDDCAGTLRKVRIELEDSTQRTEVGAIEHCGC